MKKPRLKFVIYMAFGHMVLRVLRFILPPFHMIKYKWIIFYFGKQLETFYNQSSDI